MRKSLLTTAAIAILAAASTARGDLLDYSLVADGVYTSSTFATSVAGSSIASNGQTVSLPSGTTTAFVRMAILATINNGASAAISTDGINEAVINFVGSSTGMGTDTLLSKNGVLNNTAKLNTGANMGNASGNPGVNPPLAVAHRWKNNWASPVQAYYSTSSSAVTEWPSNFTATGSQSGVYTSHLVIGKDGAYGPSDLQNAFVALFNPPSVQANFSNVTYNSSGATTGIGAPGTAILPGIATNAFLLGASGISATSATFVLGELDYEFSGASNGGTTSLQATPANLSTITGGESASFLVKGVAVQSAYLTATSGTTGIVTGSGPPVTVSIAGVYSAPAFTYWTGAGANGNFSTAANWINGLPAGGAELGFGTLASGGSAAPNNNAFSSMSGIRYLGPSDLTQGGVNSAAYTLTGNALVLTGPINNDSSSDQAINLNLALASGGGTVNTLTNNVTLNGIVSGNGGLTLSAASSGSLILACSNTYTGATTVSGGILRLINAGALPGGNGPTSSGSNLTLDGGVVELAAGDFTRNLGSGAGQVQFTANGGGFAAVGANRIVNLNNSAVLTWGSGSFLPNAAPLMLGTAASDSTIDFQNPINLGSGAQTILVTASFLTVDAQLPGVLSGSGGLTLPGNGTLELTANNTYSGATTVSGGILRLSNSAALPGGTAATAMGSNLTLDGGRVELAAGDLTRSLGSGPGQVQFTANGGGFAAVGGNRVVNLGNSALLTWGSGSFLPNGAPLMLGTWSSDSMLDFQNPINLGSGQQTILVTAGSSTSSLARLSGVLSGNGGLTVTGDGPLQLTASNTYTGATTISGGILRLSNSGALPVQSNLTLDGGVLELAAADLTTRNLGGGAGQVQFTANGGGFAAVGGNRAVNLGNSALLTWGSGSFLPNGAPLMLGTWSADSTIDFQNPINLGGGTQTVQVAAGAAAVAAQLSGVLSGGGLTVIGNGVLELTASNTYTGTTSVSGATLRLSNSGALPGGTATTTAGSNLTLDGGQVELAAGDFTRSVGSGPGQVQFTAYGGGFSAVGANRAVNLGGNSATLTWDNGGFLPNGAPLMLDTAAADSTIDFQNPLVLGSGPQTVQVTAGGGTAAIDARLSGTLSGSGGLTLTGGGTLLLSDPDNTYSGGTVIDAGTLIIASGGALPQGSDLTVGGGGTFVFDPSLSAAPEVALGNVQQIAAVPEPGTLALLAAALAVGIAVSRRRTATSFRYPPRL